MKITAVKGELTKSTHDIAFAVDEPPETDVLAATKTNLALSFRDGYLFVTVRGDHDELPPINAGTLTHIEEEYTKALQAKRAKLARAANEHDHALKEIAHYTGLKVE